MAKKLTMSIVKERLGDINPNIEILDNVYINVRSKVKCRCKIDGYIWYPTIDRLLHNHGCPICSNRERTLALDDIKERLKYIHPNIQIVSQKYLNNHSKFKCKCIVDNYEWETTWQALSKGKGCPKCNNTCRISLDYIRNYIKENFSNIELLSKTYDKNNLKLKCLACGHKWQTTWANLRRTNGCIECTKKRTIDKSRFSLDEVKNKLYKTNPNIEIISKEYLNNKSKMLFRCKIDNCEWSATWSDVSKGTGCPICGIKKISKENNYNWKGGVSSLSIYLRQKILDWKYKSFKKYNNKCVITGSSKNVIIHHLVSFNSILYETMEYLKLPIHNKISQYTEEELKLIEEKFLELHYKYGLGVCLTKTKHKEFHNIYGYGNNTKKQFIEWIETLGLSSVFSDI